MGKLTLADAGMLSPKMLRNEIVQNVDQLDRIQVGDASQYASANSVFPAIDLDAPTESYWVLGGATDAMDHVPYNSESPVGTLGDISEKDITTDGYKEKLAPEKEIDAELNSGKQVLSLYQWAAQQLRTALFLTREKIAWQGDDVVDGMIGADGQTAHPEIPTDHVLTPSTAFSDTTNATPYDVLTIASYLLEKSYQGFMEGDAPTAVEMYVSPSVWRDIKQNDNMADRFTGVEVRGLTGEQVRSLVDEAIPTIRTVRARLPRKNANGEYIDENGTVVNDIDDAVMDNVLEPYDASASTVRRNIVIGTPGAQSAFIPWFGDNMGGFDAPGAPQTAGGFAIDSNRGFTTQTWISNDPAVTWLKALQDIGFHIELPEHWVVVQDI